MLSFDFPGLLRTYEVMRLDCLYPLNPEPLNTKPLNATPRKLKGLGFRVSGLGLGV